MAHDPQTRVLGHDANPLIQETGVDKVLLVKLGLVALLLALAVAFVLQNDGRVETSFLLFTVTTQLWVGLFASLVVGALLGQAVGLLWTRRRGRSSTRLT
jgi:uncharacterized integral membrane protein